MLKGYKLNLPRVLRAYNQCTNAEQLTMTSQNYHLTEVKLKVHGELSTYSTPGKPFTAICLH